MGDRQGWGGEWARRKGIPCRGQHQQMQAGDQHSTCRKAEAAGVAGGIPGGHSAKLGEQQGWAREGRCLRLGLLETGASTTGEKRVLMKNSL